MRESLGFVWRFFVCIQSLCGLLLFCLFCLFQEVKVAKQRIVLYDMRIKCKKMKGWHNVMVCKIENDY